MVLFTSGSLSAGEISGEASPRYLLAIHLQQTTFHIFTETLQCKNLSSSKKEWIDGATACELFGAA